MLLSGDVPYPDTIDALEQALRQDHVIVQETRASGDTSGAMARIGELVSRLPFAAYVAVIDAPPDVDAGIDSSRFLATALSRRIGEPGLYVVSASGSPTGVRVIGTGWDETLFSLQANTDSDAVEAASGSYLLTPTVDVEAVLQTALAAPPQSEGLDYEDVSLPDTVVDDLAERERDLQPYERPSRSDLDEPPEPWSTGKRWMVGVAVGAGLLAVLLQSLVGWPGWRRQRGDRTSDRPSTRARAAGSPAPPDIETLRAEAGTQLTALAETLPTAPAGDRHDRAALAREVAEPLLGSDDVLDVMGALVLARAGRRELAIARRRATAPYDVCFFDPRHATATQVAEWRFGDSAVEVPVCRACRKAVSSGREPETLKVRRHGRLQPYYEGDSVWAQTGFGSLAADLGDLASRVAAARGRSR
ncbi:hypothetical protein [Nocardioides soli]|uniref:Uncharacterized protein n=1 Tax=Nocardioides soli TaxID=1036020 RepID=A0A7W4VTN1_9ACTN|nr:hypothetical protein [Nocardioides soli]MBB3041571.1 hypothetical protein [Nocardioides soli]